MGLTLDGHDIILGIDANESLDSNQSKIQQFFDKTGVLLPIHEEAFDEDYYDENPLPATYSRGSKKIDFMACTPRVMSCVTGCAIEALSSGIKTDHRPLTVDLDVTTLFGGELQRIVPDSQRVVNSKSPRTALQYRKELMRLLGEQNILKRIDRLLEKAAKE